MLSRPKIANKHPVDFLFIEDDDEFEEYLKKIENTNSESDSEKNENDD